MIYKISVFFVLYCLLYLRTQFSLLQKLVGYQISLSCDSNFAASQCCLLLLFCIAPTYIVGCQGAVQLGVPAPRFVQRGPAKVGACKSVLFTESSRVVKISQIVGVGEVCNQNGDRVL